MKLFGVTTEAQRSQRNKIFCFPGGTGKQKGYLLNLRYLLAKGPRTYGESGGADLVASLGVRNRSGIPERYETQGLHFPNKRHRLTDLLDRFQESSHQ